MTAMTAQSAMDRVLEALHRTGAYHRATPTGHTARCPAHDDHNPSLTVTNGNGKVLIDCKTGCATIDVLHALNLDWPDLFDDQPTRDRPVEVATYDYTDQAGRILYQKLRYLPKSFKVRRPHGNGHQWGIGDAQRVLYRLPELTAAITAGQPVYVVEGEKDADRLTRLSVAATCNFDGASRDGQRPKWRPEYNAVFTGADVTVIADNDPPGLAHARNIATNLRGVAARIRLARGAVTEPGADIGDHLDAGLDMGLLVDVPWVAEAEPLADVIPIDSDRLPVDAPEGEDEPVPSSWEPIDLTPYLDGTIVGVPSGILYRSDGVGLFYPGKVHWLHGESESGKSWVAQIATCAVLTAGGKVIYLDHESDPGEITERLTLLGASPAHIRERLTYLHPDDSARNPVNAPVWARILATPCDLVIIDGVTDALGLDGASTNDTDEVATWMRRMPRRIAKLTGAAVVAVDHVTKSPDTRGRFMIGSQAKMAGLNGAAFVVEPATPLGRGLCGDIILRVGKDRPGMLRQHTLGYRRSDRTAEVARVTLDATGQTLAFAVHPASEPEEPADASTAETLAALESLDVPVGAGRVKCRAMLNAAGYRVNNGTLEAALRARKSVR